VKCNVQHFFQTRNGAGSGKQGIVTALPGYRQSFANEVHPMIDRVFANANPYVHRVITPDSPGSGNATLIEFAAPVGDEYIQSAGAKMPFYFVNIGTRTNIGYTIHVCPDADPTGKCDDARIFVPDPAADGGAKPLANPLAIEQVPCAVDPVMIAAGGTDHVIGPGEANPNFFTLTSDQNYTWGSFFRYRNSGPNGSPTTLKNYAEFKAPTNWASFTTNTTVPSGYVCGIANHTTGEPPYLDGDHAIGNANVGTFTGLGNLLTFNGIVSTPNVDNYTGVIQPAHNFSVAGIGFLHANNNFVHYNPGDSGTGSTFPYGPADAVRPFSHEKFSVFGIYAYQVAQPFFSDSNSNSGWLRNTDIGSWLEGSHFAQYGIANQPTEHPFYVQDHFAVVIGNIFGGVINDGQGTAYGSFRTGRGIYLFNRGFPEGGSQSGSIVNGDGSIQDASKYYNIMDTWGPTPTWDGDCSNGSYNYPLCTPTAGGAQAFGGIDTIGAFQTEHIHSLFEGGNAFKMSTGNCSTGIPDTNGGTSLSGQHIEYFWGNNTACSYPGISWFELERPPQGGTNYFAKQPVAATIAFAHNNIAWWGSSFPNCPSSGWSDSVRMMDRINYQTNLFHAGQYSNGTTGIPVAYGNDAFESCQYGLTRASTPAQYSGSEPVEAKIGGWTTPANWITSPAQPFDGNGLQAFASSPAVGAATTPHFPYNLYTLAFNAVNASGQMTLRTHVDALGNPTDIGPADASGGPTVISIRVDAPYGTPASTINLIYPNTFQVAAHCFWSDTTETDCTTAATWSNGGSASFNVSSGASGGLISSLHVGGSGSVNATYTAITSNSVTVNVTIPPPPFVYFGPGAVIGGQSGSGTLIIH